MDKRRLKRVAVSLELYTDFITTGSEIHARCVAGLPEDAVFAGSAFDPASMAVYLFYHHESFDEVGEAENVPVFMPEFQTVPLDTRDNPDHAAVKIASFFDWVYAQNLAKTLTEEADWRKARFEEELNALKEEAASEQEPEEDSAED